MSGLDAAPEATTVTSACPGCGKPRMLDGASTRVRCAACGQEHPVEPELARAARAYREARANVPLQVAERADIERIAEESRAVANRFRRAAGLLAAPLLLVSLVGLGFLLSWPDPAKREYAVYGPALIAPLVLFLAMGPVVWWLLWRRRTAIDSLLWARPMKGIAGGLACRMCGGPIPATAATAVIACPFCRTDNMIGAVVSRAAARRAVQDYASHAARVIERVSGRTGVWLARGAFAAPLLILVVLLAITRSSVRRLLAERQPPDLSIAYVKVLCTRTALACVQRTGKDTRDACDGEDVSIVTPIRVEDLRGAHVESSGIHFDLPGNSKDLVVTEVFRDGLGRNLVDVKGFGVQAQSLVEDLCIAEAGRRP